MCKGGFAFARPRRSSEAVLSSFRHGKASLRSLAGAYAVSENRVAQFSGTCAAVLLAWRTQADPATRGRGKPRPPGCPPARSHEDTGKGLCAPRRSTPLSPLPYVSANTKAPPPARIDTLRDPSGGGRKVRIRDGRRAGKISREMCGKSAPSPALFARGGAVYLPLRGEVAAKRRVGVTHPHRRSSSRGRVTPPRSFAPTLPLKGRVGATLFPLALAPCRKTGRWCRQRCCSTVLLNLALAASGDR